MSTLQFPPLFEGLATAGADPFEVACSQARDGCDPGLVTYDLRPDKLRAAMVFAPEVPLSEAVIMLPICGVGFQNAFGALAPPEVGVHLEWNGTLRLNGGKCGALKMATSAQNADEEPDWLVVALELPLWPETDETGLTPDVTTLYDEGCSEIEAPMLLEAWVRHTLVWINRWLEDGPRAVHNEWKPLAYQLNEGVTWNDHTGTFMGADENFGMILKSGETTTIIPLTEVLTEAT